MQKPSLPTALSMALHQHAKMSDIANDQELAQIVAQLDDLNTKVQAIKEKALAKRRQQD